MVKQYRELPITQWSHIMMAPSICRYGLFMFIYTIAFDTAMARSVSKPATSHPWCPGIKQTSDSGSVRQADPPMKVFYILEEYLMPLIQKNIDQPGTAGSSSKLSGWLILIQTWNKAILNSS